MSLFNSLGDVNIYIPHN